MMNRRGSVLVKAVGGLLGLGIAGLAAHHLAGGSCPLGLCHAGKAETAVTTVSMNSGECPMAGVCPMGGGSCPAGMKRVATTEADYFEDAAPADAMTAACDQSAEMHGCPMKDGGTADPADTETLATNEGK